MRPRTAYGHGSCPTDDCEGDNRYAAPGRGHRDGCTWPMAAISLPAPTWLGVSTDLVQPPTYLTADGPVPLKCATASALPPMPTPHVDTRDPSVADWELIMRGLR